MGIAELYLFTKRVRAMTMEKHRAVNGLNVQPSFYFLE